MLVHDFPKVKSDILCMLDDISKALNAEDLIACYIAVRVLFGYFDTIEFDTD